MMMEIPDQKTEVVVSADVANGSPLFPVGMKVLVVDQRVCLRILSLMLKTCGYEGELFLLFPILYI